MHAVQQEDGHTVVKKPKADDGSSSARHSPGTVRDKISSPRGEGTGPLKGKKSRPSDILDTDTPASRYPSDDEVEVPRRPDLGAQVSAAKARVAALLTDESEGEPSLREERTPNRAVAAQPGRATPGENVIVPAKHSCSQGDAVAGQSSPDDEEKEDDEMST